MISFKKIKQKICGHFYHKFGYHNDNCVRCGINYRDAIEAGHGCITSNLYDTDEDGDRDD